MIQTIVRGNWPGPIFNQHMCKCSRYIDVHCRQFPLVDSKNMSDSNDQAPKVKKQRTINFRAPNDIDISVLLAATLRDPCMQKLAVDGWSYTSDYYKLNHPSSDPKSVVSYFLFFKQTNSNLIVINITSYSYIRMRYIINITEIITNTSK